MTFNPLDHPITLMYPERTAQSAWTEHIPLAMLLVDLLRPSRFVELGTHYGTSYCAFAQAVKHLGIDCRCFAVDTWAGDEHTGGYGHSVLNELKSYHDVNYGAFSTLIQSTFDDANPRFADGSIDLLHIDGYHTYDAVRHDFELWLPKMSARGVVIFHDIAERTGDFGVWKLWDELEARYPYHLAVDHGHGLGIVAVGETVPEGARELFALSGATREALRTLLYELGRRIEEREDVKRLWDAGQALTELQERLTAERSRHESELEAVNREHELALENAQRQIATVESRLRGAEWQLNWFESSRGVRAIKLARAARHVLREKGPRDLSAHVAQWLLGKRGYHLRDLTPSNAGDIGPAATPGLKATALAHKGVLYISGVPDSAMRYRCAHNAEALGFAGYTSDQAIYGQVDLADVVARYACFVLHRVPDGPDVQKFIEQAHDQGKLVFFDTDDLVFEPEAITYVAALPDLPPEEQRLYLEGMYRYQRAMKACDGVIVSTQTLRERALAYHDNVVVIPNVMSAEMIRLSDAALEWAAKAGSTVQRDSLTIGYFSGTPTHNVDFLQAADAILWALERYPEAVFKVIGRLKLDERFDKYAARIVQFSLQRWQELPRIYTTVDISIAPLEPDNPFTDSKSCIKYLEAALCVVPTIASPRADFVRTVEHGVTGFLADSPEDWKDALARLIESPELRREMGQRASERVRAEETTLARSSSAQRAMRSLAKISDAKTSDAKFPAIGAERPALTVNWVLHAPIAERGGGYRTIFRLANALGEQGHTVRVYVEPTAHLALMTPEEIAAYVERHFGKLNGELIVGHENILPADVSIATFWTTAATVHRRVDSPSKLYFIQDFEPEFYDPADALYVEAEKSYSLPLRHVCIGAHLGRRIEAFSGRESSVIDFAIDQTVFHCSRAPEDRDGPPKVLFFARPGLKRRGFELGIEALRRVKAQRPDVEVLLFGATDDELGNLPFEATNLGIVTHEQLVEALNSVHIQLSFSLSNISWVPFEGMACGAAVVEADVPSVRSMIPCEDACLLAKPNPEAVAEAILRLVENDDLRCRVATTGAAVMAERTWEHSAAQFEEILLRHCWLRESARRARRAGDEPLTAFEPESEDVAAAVVRS